MRTKPLPPGNLLPEYGLVKRPAAESRKEWAAGDRRSWCIRVHETFSSHRMGFCYYRCRIPLCEPLSVLIACPKYATAVQAGYFKGLLPVFKNVAVSPVLMVPDGDEDVEKLHIGHGRPVLLWDRDLIERNAQHHHDGDD